MGLGSDFWMGASLFILISPLFIFGIAFFLSPVGILWAPFGALICAILARKRGMNAWRYAAVGALYSVLFFWPWVYLVARMDDRTLHRGLIVLFYFGVYVLWLCVIGVLVYIGIYNHPGWAQVANLSNPWVWLSSGDLTAAGAGVVTWCVSLVRHIKRYKAIDSQESNDFRASTLPHFDCLAPVAYMTMWLVGTISSHWLATNLITTPHRFAGSMPQF